TIGEGELMAHDVPLGCAPDEYDDLISGTCSHLPQALMTHHNFLRNFPSSGISVNGFRLTMRPLYQENHAELLPFVC
ncbi:hypothetical protein, partial [Klebsiella pneumoniae]|uniref:hypothetical protein n=1 Tax=Klebsiella pneumoniae TaxID=573 RepID=UPI0039699143